MEVYDEQAIIESAIESIKDDFINILIERGCDHVDQMYVGIPEEQYKKKVKELVNDEIELFLVCAKDALIEELDKLAESISDNLDGEYDSDWQETENEDDTPADVWNSGVSATVDDTLEVCYFCGSDLEPDGSCATCTGAGGCCGCGPEPEPEVIDEPEGTQKINVDWSFDKVDWSIK